MSLHAFCYRYFSFVGNGIVILVLHKQRLILQPTDLLMLNLAITDAAIAVFGYSQGIVKIFRIFRDMSSHGSGLARYIGEWFSNPTLCLSSINTLTAIRVTRYLKEYHANKGYSVSRSTILISIIFIWKGTLFWSMAALLGWGDRGYGTCDVDWFKANCSTTYK
ncbi:hypothetical protein P4O66_012595 [Electrophorus voltai]|uniref:G-protein coupled receptors family 1 profile domain-containing protein n=1 Tax=Electrophorus voltai TaxID=2609070 RepID=A0AAD8Z730_9TELE|nr:hypothetical protein P4O66_012595 [Electrophorus voltai]